MYLGTLLNKESVTMKSKCRKRMNKVIVILTCMMYQVALKLMKSLFPSYEEPLEKLNVFNPPMKPINRVPGYAPQGILHSDTLFQPSRTSFDTSPLTFSVEPEEGHINRANFWALEQASYVCCQTSIC